MLFFAGILIGAVQAITAITGSFVASKKFTYKQKRPFFWVFVGLAILGLGLTIWQAFLTKRGSEDSTRAANGDPEHPPFIALISFPGVHRFVVTNGSNYPSFGVRIRMYEDTAKNGPARIVRDWVYPEMGAHQALMDDQLWVPPDDTPQRHFTATIATRTGVASEELLLRKTENNQWMRASRVTQGMRLLETDIDSAWPRNAKGDVEWGR
jgi:hypothetical protein